MPRLTHLALAALAPALLLQTACQPVYFSARVDVPEMCISGLEVSFPPGAAAATADNTLTADDIGLSELDPVNVDLSVNVLAVGLTPDAGVTDLGFLDTLRVKASSLDDSAELPAISVIEMDRGDYLGDGAMYAEQAQPVNIATYLRAGQVAIAVDLEGDLPQVEWSTQLDLCVHAAAGYQAPL